MDVLCGWALWVCSVGVLCGCALWMCSVGVLCGCSLWVYAAGGGCECEFWVFYVVISVERFRVMGVGELGGVVVGAS